jgi:hypothetical protein
MRDSIPDFVARENIPRFERQISKTTDGQERKFLLGLLCEELLKLEPVQINSLERLSAT